MALVIIRCPCGCVFRRDETSEKVCPSCGAYHAAGQGPSESLSSGTLRTLLVLASSVLAGLLLVLIALLNRERPPSVPPVPPVVRRFEPVPPPPTPPPPPPKPEPAPPPQPPPPRLEGREIARAWRLVARANLGALAEIVLRHSGAPDAADHLRAGLNAEHVELSELLGRHPRRPELRALPDRVEPQDTFLAFSAAAFDPRQPGPFVEAVRTWFRTLQPGACTLISVRRQGETLTFPIYVPPLDEDLTALVRLTGVAPGAGGVGDPPPPRALSSALLGEARRRLDALHPVHRDSLPPDLLARADAILRDGAGSDEDGLFLRVTLLDQTLRPLEEELDALRRKLAELEARGTAPLLPDLLVFKDGRRLNVRILDESPIRFHVRVAAGEARISAAEIASVERGQAALTELEARYQAARDDIPALLALLPALREPRYAPLRELVCHRVLVLDPLHETAWAELGFKRRAPPAPPRERDVVRLKDGSSRAGLLAEESEASVTIETPLKGSRGETLGAARVKIDRADIERVDRMSEEARAKALARNRALEEGRLRAETDLSRFRLAPATFHGFKGVSVSGTHFELLSTAPERETRETAHTLETTFGAFQREFGARRNAGRRILVHFLADRAQYDAFQRASRGAVLPNPAYFSVKENHVAAYDPVQNAEARAVRAAIAKAEADIESYRKALAAEEGRVDDQLRLLRGAIADQAAARRRAAEGLPLGERERALEAVERWKDRETARLRQTERSLRDQFGEYRREARKAIESNQAVSRRNNDILAARAVALRETLTHEAFHAFAANFLWAELDNARLPRWLHEGFASYFETGLIEAGEFSHGAPHPRHLALLRELARGGRLLPAATVLRAGPDTFAADHLSPSADVPYAHAWLLAHWLASRGLDREALERYAQAVSKGGDPVEALASAAGLGRAALDAAVRSHLDQLR